MAAQPLTFRASPQCPRLVRLPAQTHHGGAAGCRWHAATRAHVAADRGPLVAGTGVWTGASTATPRLGMPRLALHCRASLHERGTVRVALQAQSGECSITRLLSAGSSDCHST